MEKAAKRGLPCESSSNTRTAKRRRSSNMHPPSASLITVSGREQPNSRASEVKAACAGESGGDDSPQSTDEDSDSESGTSSSSSDVEKTSEDESSDGEGARSLSDVGQSPSSGREEDPSEGDGLIQHLPLPKKPSIAASAAKGKRKFAKFG